MPFKHSHKHTHSLSSKAHGNSIFMYLVYFISIVEPLSSIPQIYNIWFLKQTEGVSFLSWLCFLIAAFIWLMYGLSRKDKALIISSLTWVVLEGIIVLGLIIYR